MIRVTRRMTRKSNDWTTSDHATLVTRVYLHEGCTCSRGFTPVGKAATEEEAARIAVGLRPASIAYCARSGAKAGRQVTAQEQAPVKTPARRESAKEAYARLALTAQGKAELKAALFQGGPVTETIAHLFDGGQPTADAYVANSLRPRKG